MSRSNASSRSCHTGHIIIISMLMNYHHYSHYFSSNEICSIAISVRGFACRVFSVRAQLSSTNIAIKTEASSEKQAMHVRKQQASMSASMEASARALTFQANTPKTVEYVEHVPKFMSPYVSLYTAIRSHHCSSSLCRSNRSPWPRRRSRRGVASDCGR